jgi:hypothetical protein
MRKFDSTMRIRRCRNARSTSYSGCERQVAEQCGPENQPERYEVTLIVPFRRDYVALFLTTTTYFAECAASFRVTLTTLQNERSNFILNS